MRKVLFMILGLIVSTSWAQIGINTSTPLSTLSVNGSYSGKYKEVYITDYEIRDDDYAISYTGESRYGSFKLPSTANINDRSTGRVYHIKNLSKTQVLDINALQSQLFRSGSFTPQSTHMSLKPGDYVSLISNGIDGWDLLSPTEPRMDRKVTVWDNNVASNSQISVGRLTVRCIKQEKYDKSVFMQFRYDINSNASIGFQKQSTYNDTNYYTYYRSKMVYANQWNFLHNDAGSGSDNVNLIQRGMMIVNIAFEETGEIYRVSLFGFLGNEAQGIPMKLSMVLEKVN